MLIQFTNLDGLPEYVNPLHVALVRVIETPGKRVTALRTVGECEYLRVQEDPQVVVRELSSILSLCARSET